MACLCSWDIGEKRDNVKANQDIAGLSSEVPGDLNELAGVGYVVLGETRQGTEDLG